ncbi:MAG: xanthine phosphoribosyltransferase [Bacteroidales bacterium]|jgi:xanthine phosphoribosyltransferase|nr:xanthine phosphoribosyltransferase [Bacteroidales bacterium]MDD2322425.1 xanthine phosphoribosyltransferase [Bacteroidales bacterium]MDD3009951.1 xanthine phosphoribosyltransferase [Bacteroidales bacterium]MDD3960996.1 xanthine phosphoribosyltransferase [Bacteroidales bacterium]MDY0284583.1 xanthine phosphoribosyltransferase [Bacteroidales bacterium]
MEELKQRILRDGHVIHKDVLKVDGFLNHQLDIGLLDRIGEQFYARFHTAGVTKILTIESSGIAVATLTARHFKVPVVFARKAPTMTHLDDKFSAEVYSYTQRKQFTIFVSSEYISHSDKVLVIDDFLANGQALLGLAKIVHQSGAALAGAGIVIEKAFQDGGDLVRNAGIDVFSLAKVAKMSHGKIYFAD